MIAIACGKAPTEMVAVTVFDAVSITERVLENSFATYTVVPLRFDVTPTGISPTGILFRTVRRVVSTTETVSSSWFAT